MKYLNVLFDAECQFCVRCAKWLRSQPQYVQIRVIPMQRATGALAALVAREGGQEVLAVSDEGAVYKGDRAWLVALWALKRYRGWSHRLASPALRGFTRRLYRAVAEHRTDISRWVGPGMSDESIANALGFVPEPDCHADRGCATGDVGARGAAGNLRPTDFRRLN